MNYSGNMPDWHQYNPPQSGINDVTSTAQNVNSGHLPFIPNITPTQLNHGLNLGAEGHEKHQNDSTFNPRHFQPHLSSNISHGHNAADNTPLASMVQMQNCIGHYGPSNTQNPMVDNLNGPMDPRSTAIGGLSDELGYRNNQVPLNGPITHLNGPSMMNMNAPHGHIGPRNANVNSHATSRAGPPSFVSCKGPCCNSDPNIGYQQWEKYCSYQNNTAYRENMCAPGYQTTDARRFSNDYNFRKDNFDGKEVLPPAIVPNASSNADHRRSYPESYKYGRKDRLLSRSYPPTTGMLQNYPMQGYNCTGEYQKYPYNVKECTKMSSMNVPGQGMVKHQEQGFMAQQQKYSGVKQQQQQQQQQQQMTYQSSAMMPTNSVPSTSVNPNLMPSAQNTYFNPPQYPRNLSTEAAHDCQEVADNMSVVNRMQMSGMHPPGPYSRFQMYQQKLAIQRFSMENQLRELTRIPGYQSHPRYKECLQKYRELLKMQQSFAYHSHVQQTPPCASVSASVSAAPVSAVPVSAAPVSAAPVIAATVNAATVNAASVNAATVNAATVNAASVPPINLQFDQNGVLINSSYIPEAFPQIQQVLNSQPAAAAVDSSDKQPSKPENNVASVQKQAEQQQLVVPRQQHDAAHAAALCPNVLQKRDRYSGQKSLEAPDVQFVVQQKTGSENFGSLSGSNTGETTAAMQQKISKEFADKPQLDVRQFLANWDESEDEDGAAGSNMQNVVLSNSTPVVVVGYENVDLSAKTLEGLRASKPAKMASGVVAFENRDKSGVAAPQDCLTISYSAAKNVEIAKDVACKQLAKDNIVPPGSIIQCISNGPDEVPTIHIVDNLEIGSILQVTSGQVAETQETVSFFHEGVEIEASAIALEKDKFKKTDSTAVAAEPTTDEYNTAGLKNLSDEKYIIESGSSSSPKTTDSTSQTSQMSDGHEKELATSTAPAKDNLDNSAQGINLMKKQSSFTSEESHNPDDISLPDLPTSECTPISTTLNTPIHSDSEEASDRVEDLTIPTNPIEVVQNSPIISFTQSPMRGEPYDHLSNEAAGVKSVSKSADSLKSRYQTGNRFNEDGSNNILEHDNVLGAFEFPTAADKSRQPTVTARRDNNKKRTGGSNASIGDEGTFALDGGVTNAEMTGMCMTLTPGDYELKIVSAGMQSGEPLLDDKNSTIGSRRASESQACNHDVSEVRKTLRTLSESGARAALRYSDSAELDKALRNIAGDSDRAVVSESKSRTSVEPKKCAPAEPSAHQATTSAMMDSSAAANDAASKGGSRPAAGDGSPSKITKSSSFASHSTKHPTLGNDKLRKSDKSSARGDPSAERSGRSSKSDSRDSRHVGRHSDHRVKSSGGGQADSHGKRSESSAEKCSEATVHHNKHTQEATAHRAKTCAVGDLKGPADVSRSEPRSCGTSGNVDENRERLRLLKEYRRIKYKSPGVTETSSKTKDAQEVTDYRASKRCHSSSSEPDRPGSQLPADKQQLCQKDASFRSAEEQERNHAIRKTFMSKNVNPDFAIQVTNVNLKLKENDRQKEVGEEVTNSGALDAIKIEINVSCTERNTAEKLLHENIKNAVAETIGHLTSSISSGARSSSASLTEIQCDKKMLCNQAADSRDYDKHERSPAASRDSAYDDPVKAQDNQDNANAARYKSAVTAGKDSVTNDGSSGSLGTKKRRGSLSSQGEAINNVYEAKANVNLEAESSTAETSKSEHAPIVRRRSLHQDADQARKVTNFPANSEESRASADTSSHTGPASSRSGSAQRKEQHQETTFLCRRNSQDNLASRLNAGASTSTSSAVNLDIGDPTYDNNSAHMDYDHFDVAPNDDTDADDKRMDRWKRSRRDDGRFNSLYEPASGYVNPIFFSMDKLQNLNTVPVYTTKDGKITYSPNPRFTYHELLMEARAKESSTRDPYFARSPSFDYYNCSKLRKVFKRANRDVAAARKRENVEPGADGKPQFAAKHADYLPSKNAHHTKARNTPHLEFFNDGADQLYTTSRSDQPESKEAGKKNVMDLSFLEKPCDPDEGESASNVKQCKTNALAENLDYEKGCNESAVFDPNIFLEPRALCWDETMESVKSYSSHIDRRNSGNLKELSFSEIFAKQKRPDSSLHAFLHAEQESVDDNGRHKASNICNAPCEPPTLPLTACSYTGGDSHLIPDDDARCEQQPNTVALAEQENTSDNGVTILSTTDINDESTDAHGMPTRDEYTTKQRSQLDQLVKTDAIVRVKETSPSLVEGAVNDEDHVLEKDDECPTNEGVQDLTKSLAEDGTRVSSSEDKPSGEDCASVKEASDANSILEITNLPKSSAECDDLPDEPKCTETVEAPATATDEEKIGGIDDTARNNSDSTVNVGEAVYQQILESAVPVDREDEGEAALPPVTESNVEDGQAVETYFNDETSERGDSCTKENNPTLRREKEEEKEEEKEAISPPDAVVAMPRPLDEQSNEQKSRNPRADGEQLAKDSSKDPGIIDEVDDCGGAPVLFESTVTLDMSSLQPEESVCDIFASEKREQNISEFTVIKSIIKADKEQCEQPREETGVEMRETVTDNDSIIIDPKLLCIDSSDCGIYAEDRCALISEHDFTEEDSIVPMQWETSQIQEDAVKRLCGIDESSIDFAAAANSLRSEDNSLLDNLSLSRCAMKESQLLELPVEVAQQDRPTTKLTEVDKPVDEPVTLVAADSVPSSPPPILEKLQAATTCDDESKEQKEQDPVSSSSYEQVAYLRGTDCNANTKIVPKLVIKKTETSSKSFVTKVSSSPFTDSNIAKSALRPSCQPKIPKMIIRNARSRPGTPSIEAVPDETPGSVSERVLVTARETWEDPYENDSENSMQSSASYRNKIPKMKIKLDEKHANKIVRADDSAELGAKRKNMKRTIPKVKIKNSPRREPSDNSFYNRATSHEPKSPEKHEERIPVLKLRKQERDRSSSPEVIRKRQSSSHSDVPTKRYKRSGRDDTRGYFTRRSNSDSAQTTATECGISRNTTCTSEKIPKVIIKRTSASAEFKCELSKSGKNMIAKSAKWQPEVKLERYRILDGMAKDLKSSFSLAPVSLQIIDKIFASRKNSWPRKGRHSHKLSRSNSTSDLLPAKCKQRRMSDYDYRKISGALREDLRVASPRNADDLKACEIKTSLEKSARGHGKSSDERRKGDKRRSRSRDQNPPTEANVVLSEKGTIEKDRSIVRSTSSEKVISSRRDECKTDDGCDIKPEEVAKTKEDSSSLVKLDPKNPLRHYSSTNFKNALKELKATSKAENCLVEIPGSSEIPSKKIEAQSDKERRIEDDPFLCMNDDKVTMKERLDATDVDIDAKYLQDDVISLKEEPVSILNSFEMDNNAVIKIESSDDSQTTIEILPASPDDSRGELESHIIDDGNSEQLYSADAIPTQFELELEITDNSNIDLLDVSMPRLNPVAYCSSRCVSTEDCYDSQVSKARRYNKPGLSHRSTSPHVEDRHTEIGLNDDDDRAASSQSVKLTGCVDEISSKFPCVKEGAEPQAASKQKSFCCSDSLIKEVLAAKETLKKCLSRSRCESGGAKPNTEKKQGSSFDLNSLSETHSKSSNASQGCRDNATLRTDSVASGHSNKTESIAIAEKSDKKHSKTSKSVLVKKRVKPPDKRDEEPRSTLTTDEDSRGTTEHECTTISLKRFARVAASPENPPRPVNLSERRRKSSGDQTDTVPRKLSRNTSRKEENKISSYKIPKIPENYPVDQGANVTSGGNDTKPKEDNMPILEPAVVVSFDAGSDRDNSRSPPIITNQDTANVNTTAAKLADNEVITSDNKVEIDAKDVHKKSEMSVSDFISQLAYDKKTTIKHRRYCNLCERWFSTTSRHQRHLAGYQHRQIESAQRKSIHAMFALFTGKPCPRLMPANVMRNDCSVGELTPLQIAVQDVTKRFDHTEHSPKKQNDVDK